MNAAALAARTGWPPDELAAILDDEQRRGRGVRNEAGAYAIVLGAFAPETVEALRELA